MARLVAAGRLRYADRVCRYLPRCADAWAPITIEELLTHTSGIPNYAALPDFPALIGTPVTPQALVARFADLPLRFSPGSQFRYSNSGYVVLGYVVERITGRAYGDVLRSEVLDPLGLAGTGYGTVPAGAAVGYRGAGVRAVYVDPSEAYSAGGLYSTVDDLGRWDRAVGAGLLVPADTVLTPRLGCPAEGCVSAGDTGYGYGWAITSLAGRTLDYHLGGYDGYVSFNGYLPATDVEVVVLSNVETTDVAGIGRHLADLSA